MTSSLAVLDLYDRVVARMAAALGASAPEASFGWREPAVHATSARSVVWVPGEDGDLGAFAAPRSPGRNPRSLATLHELVTIYVEAFDDTDIESERAQYEVCRTLLDDLLQALYLEAHGAMSIESARWVDDKALRRAGAAVRLVIAVQAVIPDAVSIETTAGSSTDVAELDQTETVTTQETAP